MDLIRRHPERVVGRPTALKCAIHPRAVSVLREITAEGHAVVSCRVTYVNKKTGARRQDFHCRRCLPLPLAGVRWPGKLPFPDLRGVNGAAPAASPGSGYNGVPPAAPPGRKKTLTIRRGADQGAKR